MGTPTGYANNATHEKERTEAMANLALTTAIYQETVKDLTDTVSCISTDLAKVNVQLVTTLAQNVKLAASNRNYGGGPGKGRGRSNVPNYVKFLSCIKGPT